MPISAPLSRGTVRYAAAGSRGAPAAAARATDAGESDGHRAENLTESPTGRRFMAVEASEVKARRKELGLTQRQFADFLGVQKNSVWRWENGWPVTAPYAELIRLKAAAAALVEQPA